MELPLELIEMIAMVNLESYRVLLAIPAFARMAIGKRNVVYRRHFTSC